MNPLVRPTARRTRTRIRAEAPAPRTGDAGVVSLRLYDPLDSWGEWFGVSAREFVEVLDELPGDTSEIRLLINSPGGEVSEGLAMLNALRAHPARVVAVVEGIAASAASFVAAGVDELVMAQNSELFVHRAWGIEIGNADDMERYAAYLNHEDTNIAGIYAAKAGDDVDTWLGYMGAETWFTAAEAAAAGLADRVLDQDGASAAAAARARFDLSALTRHTPSLTTSPAAAAGASTGRSRAVAFTDDQMSGLRQLAGVGEDADEQTVLDALGEALGEASEGSPGGEGTATAAARTAAPATAQLPEGVVAIDGATLAELQAAARRGDEARAEQERTARNATVNAAVLDGRIPAARAEHWRAQLAADPGAADTLAGLAPGLVPVEARGHDGNPTAQTDPAAGDSYWFPGYAHPTAATQGS